MSAARLLAALALLGALAIHLPALANDQDSPSAGMKARVFELRNQETSTIINAIRPLGSGARGAMITESDTLRTITVRDFPENLAAIEQALKRLDAPTPPKPDVELKIRVLIAAPTGPGQVPQELDSVVKQLQSTLTFKSYYQVASITHRIRVGAGATGKGTAQLLPPSADEPTLASYTYGLDNLAVSTATASAPPVLNLKKFRFSMENKLLGEADISTGLTLKDGHQHKVVVGTGSLRNRAVIVILSAKVVN